MFRSTAHVYDLVYAFAGKDYAAETAALVRLIHERAPHASSVLDHLVDQHWLTLFTRDEHTAAFAAAGLTPEIVAGPHEDRDRYVATAPR